VDATISYGVCLALAGVLAGWTIAWFRGQQVSARQETERQLLLQSAEQLREERQRLQQQVETCQQAQRQNELELRQLHGTLSAAQESFTTSITGAMKLNS
jgi:DNA recombination protein RmuC